MLARLLADLRRLLLRRKRPQQVTYTPAAEIADPAWEKARTIPTARGDLVRSWGEAKVADWLYHRGVRYEYEPAVAGRRPDFYLPDLGLIVEYSGVDNEEYERRHAERMKAYDDARIPFVSLRGRKWAEMERELDAALRRWGWRPPRM